MNLGIVGLGAWARNILNSIPETASVTCVVTSRADAAEHAPRGAAIVRDVAKISYDDLDGVIVANEASRHVATLREIWERAPRLPVFVEKPVAMNPRELDSLAAEFPAALLLVDHIQLFNENLRQVKQSLGGSPVVEISGVDEGIGPVRADCSALWDYGPHAVSIALYLAGGEGPARKPRLNRATGSAGFGATRVEFDLDLGGGATAALSVGNDSREKRRRYRVRAADGTERVFDGLAQASPPPLGRALGEFCAAVAAGAAPADDFAWGWKLPLAVTDALSDVNAALA